MTSIVGIRCRPRDGSRSSVRSNITARSCGVPETVVAAAVEGCGVDRPHTLLCRASGTRESFITNTQRGVWYGSRSSANWNRIEPCAAINANIGSQTTPKIGRPRRSVSGCVRLSGRAGKFKTRHQSLRSRAMLQSCVLRRCAQRGLTFKTAANTSPTLSPAPISSALSSNRNSNSGCSSAVELCTWNAEVPRSIRGTLTSSRGGVVAAALSCSSDSRAPRKSGGRWCNSSQVAGVAPGPRALPFTVATKFRRRVRSALFRSGESGDAVTYRSRDAGASSGCARFSWAISKGSGREACDDPASRLSSRGGVESRHAAKIAMAGRTPGKSYRSDGRCWGRWPVHVAAEFQLAGVATGPREAFSHFRVSGHQKTKSQCLFRSRELIRSIAAPGRAG